MDCGDVASHVLGQDLLRADNEVDGLAACETIELEGPESAELDLDDEPAAGLGLVILATCAPPVAQEAFEVLRPSVRQQRDQKQAPVLPRRLPPELLHPPKIVVHLAGPERKRRG